MRFTVGGEEYGSKAALQREWRERTKRYPGKGRVEVSPEDTVWFIGAAFASGTHLKYLFDGEGGELPRCLAMNTVHVNSAGAAFGPRGKAVSKHIRKARCVFFGSVADPLQCRTVPSNLGDTKGKKQATIGWLRQAVQGQIDAYRRSRKLQSSLVGSNKYRAYNCEICKRTCRGKENHIDHGTGDQSFKVIILKFQSDCLLRPVTSEDGEDSVTRARWQKFHKKLAQLSLTCRPCNLANK